MDRPFNYDVGTTELTILLLKESDNIIDQLTIVGVTTKLTI